MIGQTISHYRILEKIGSGGMGVVYKAEDTRLGRLVALKFLPEELSRDAKAVERFEREARAASALNHPNICTIHEIDAHHGQQFIVMELLEGQTLAERIQGKPLETKKLLEWGLQAAEALEAAHSKGIIHRDIKPGNIFLLGAGAGGHAGPPLPDRGQVKVLDFGLAKLLRPASDAALTESLTKTHAVVGTLPYMSPEQLRSEEVDARTDVYALGAVLYEMATGRRPFAAATSAALAADILNKVPAAPGRTNAELGPRLDDIILKCLEKDPESRYQSAKELAVDLRRLGAPGTATEVRIEVGTGAGGAARARLVWPIVAGTAVVLVAGIALGLNVGGWQDRLWPGTRPGRIESLAILPLENLSGDPEQSYFADGMTEELITDLGQISALRVISRTSVMHYKGTRETTPEIARELNVDAVVEGSVERAGDRVRITAQLIEARTDRHLWAKHYEREFRNALQLQDEVAQAIAGEIQIKLTPQEKSRLVGSRTVNPDAYNDYLKGRYFAYQWTGEGARKAQEYFQRAIEEDPNYAPAWALWADTLQFARELPPQETAKRAQEALQKALQLDDSLAEVHTAIAAAKLNYEWDWAGGEKELRRAIELNPNYAEAHHVYSHYLIAEGRMEESLRESQRALECDPLNVAMSAHLAAHYIFARQYDQAIAQARRALEMDPNYYAAHAFLADAEEDKGDLRTAVAEFQKLLELPGGKEPDILSLVDVGHAFAAAGEQTELQRIIKYLRGKGPRGYPALASISAGLGEKERSLDFLNKAADERTLSFFAPINRDPNFDTLHSEPRYQELLRRMGLPQ